MKQVLMDEWIIPIFNNDIKTALENAGFNTSDQNVERVMGLAHTINENINRFAAETLECLILERCDELNLEE